MIWFTSDLHLGHRGIIAMQNRPFDSAEEILKENMTYVKDVAVAASFLFYRLTKQFNRCIIRS